MEAFISILRDTRLDENSLNKLEVELHDFKETLPKAPSPLELPMFCPVIMSFSQLSSAFLEQQLRSNSNMNKTIRFKLLFSSFIVYVFPCLVDELTLALNCLQELILTTRMCLDQGFKYLSQVRTIAKFVNDQLKNSSYDLSANYEFLHHLNNIEIYKYQIDNSFQVEGLLNKLNILATIENPDYQNIYREHISSVVFEVCIRLLKKCETLQDQESILRQLSSYLNQKLAKIIQALYLPDQQLQVSSLEMLSDIEGIGSQYFQLFLYVRQHGFRSLSEHKLEQIIDKCWNQKGYFEILGYRPAAQALIPLKIWFKVCYMKDGKTPLLQDAIKLFFGLTETLSQNSNAEICALAVQFVQVASLSKKGTDLPIVNIVQRLSQIFLHLAIHHYPQQRQMITLYESMVSLCKKHAITDINRDLCGIICFYLHIHGQMQIFSQYYKEYNALTVQTQNPVKQLLRCLVDNNIDSDLISNYPQLFQLLLFKFPEHTLLSKVPFHKLPPTRQILDIFANLLSNHQNPTPELLDTLGTRIQQIAETWKLNEIDLNRETLNYLRNKLLVEAKAEILTASQAYRLVTASVYCQLLINGSPSQVTTSLRPHSYFIGNKCLKKILNDSPSLSQNFCRSIPILLLKAVTHHLTIRLTSARSFQEGQVQFLQLNYNVWESQGQRQNIGQMMEFLQFQLMILSDNQQDAERMITATNDLRLLKLFNSADCLSLPIKVSIIKKLIRVSSIEDEPCEINFQDMKAVIMNTMDYQEQTVYVRHMLMTGGEEALNFLNLLAHKSVLVNRILNQIAKDGL